MERTRNVLLDVLYSHERLTRLLLSSPEEGRSTYSHERLARLLLYLVQRRNFSYIPMSASRAYFYLSCPEEERSITENALVV